MAAAIFEVYLKVKWDHGFEYIVKGLLQDFVADYLHKKFRVLLPFY